MHIHPVYRRYQTDPVTLTVTEDIDGRASAYVFIYREEQYTAVADTRVEAVWFWNVIDVDGSSLLPFGRSLIESAVNCALDALDLKHEN